MFTRTKHGANRLAEQLGRDGIATAAIHGNKAQAQRVRALADFKAGRVAVLVATDIAARGLDIDSLPFVVNYEMPMVPEDYIHRIGRTGRAGAEGMAISLVCVDEGPLLHAIERLLRRAIAVEVVPGFEPDRSIAAGADPPALGRASGDGSPAARRRRGSRATPAPCVLRAAPRRAAQSGRAGTRLRAARRSVPSMRAPRPGATIGRPQPTAGRPHRPRSRVAPSTPRAPTTGATMRRSGTIPGRASRHCRASGSRAARRARPRPARGPETVGDRLDPGRRSAGRTGAPAPVRCVTPAGAPGGR